MVRQLFLLSTPLLLAFGASQGFSLAQDRSSWPQVVQVQESKPITVNDAKFVTVAEAQWHAYEDPNSIRPVAVETRLRITNLKKSALVFPVNVTFVLTIKDKDGKELKPEYGTNAAFIPTSIRDAAPFARPILIPAGASFSIVRQAYLTWNPKTKASSLGYRDGKGAWAMYGPLHSGKYKISFLYSTTRVATPGAMRLIDDIPVWSGDAQTAELSFEVVNPRFDGKSTNR